MREKREEALDTLFHKPDDIGHQLTPEEELERLAWELNVAETNYWRAVAKYRDVTQPINREKEKIQALVRKHSKVLKAIAAHDSGVSEVDQSPGSELTDYTDKHGQ